MLSQVAGPSRLGGVRRYATAQSKKRLVVLGSGWAGYSVARQVDKELYDVTVISPNSYFSFTPFLASTAVGTLEYRCATEPVRGIKGVNYYQGWADSIDRSAKTITVEPALPPTTTDAGAPPSQLKNKKDLLELERTIANEKPLEKYQIGWDKLVVAVGCYSADFGIPGVSQHAFFLKDIRDARAIRNRVLERLEQALLPHTTEEQRRALLAFRIVGGGPTGIEFAAELHDFIHEDVYRLYPSLKDQVEITVYDVAPGILMNFDKSLREYAMKRFARTGINVRTEAKITAVGAEWLELDGNERLPHGLLVWNTGLSANPFIKGLEGVSKDEKTSSLKVDEHLRVLDASGQPMKDVYAAGDNARPESGALPATGQVASQMAKHLAKQLNASAKGQDEGDMQGFRWKNRGSMVFIGDQRGLIDRSSSSISGRLSGFAAWIIWRSYYMTLSMGWRNKALVPMYWALAWMFGRDVTRF